MLRGIGGSVAIVAAAVVVLWLVGQAAGFHVSLWSSLLISVALTLLLNLGLRAFRRRRT